MTAKIYDLNERRRAVHEREALEDLAQMLEEDAEHYDNMLDFVPEDYDTLLTATGLLGMSLDIIKQDARLVPECLVDVHYNLDTALNDFLLALSIYWEDQHDDV